MGSYQLFNKLVTMKLSALLLTIFISNVLSTQQPDFDERLRDWIFSLANRSGNESHYKIPEELDIFRPYARHLNLKVPVKVPRQVRELLCDACIVGIEAIVDLVMLGVDITQVEEVALIVCDLFNIEDHDVCDGAIHNYAPQLDYIIHERRITGQHACAIALGNGCGDPSVNSWTVDLPLDPKPEVVPPSPPQPDSPTMKILQISDVHLDLSYTIGSNAGCDLPNCCMDVTGIAEKPEDEAQYWGDYRCDLPAWTFRHVAEHIKETHGDIDYIIMTGDYPAHDVWLQSRQNNLMHTKTVVDTVNEFFTETPIFPSMGNHESFPCNSYPTSNVDGDGNPAWLYDTLADYFSSWLPEQQLEQFRVDGFYSIDFSPELKLIGVNSNMCLTYNFYLFLEWQDPGNELAWLIQELLASEQKGQKVHILSHIPPGNDDCLGAWGREFAKIISRFEGTVTAQFYGHTHNDEFMVFYDTEDNSRAVNFGFVAPSVTTFTDLNPAYRIYTVDAGYEGASYRVLESETYIFDMTAANMAGQDVQPEWYKLYTATQDLNMDNLFPQSWDTLVRNMAVDADLYSKFHNYYNQDRYQKTKAQYDVLCPLVTTSNLDRTKCEEILGPAPDY